jgi:hypothetical protein
MEQKRLSFRIRILNDKFELILIYLNELPAMGRIWVGA